MTPTARSSEPVTATDLVAAVRAARGEADAAETRVFSLALAWCDAHPAVPGEDVWHAAARRRADTRPVCWLEDPGHADEDDLEWFGLPEVSWSAPAGFAAANAMTTAGGRAYLRDALVLRHRLPRLHARVVMGLVPVWRARRVAASVLGEPADVVTAVDLAVADHAESWGPIQISNIIDAIKLELHTEAVELAAETARLSRYARLDDRSTGADGLGFMEIKADLTDLAELDRALSDIAARLDAEADSLDVRRARAVGILADPAAALDLLSRATCHDGSDAGSDDAEPRHPTRRVELVVHLSARVQAGDAAPGSAELFGPVTHPAQDHEPGPFGRAFLTQAVREWCARPGTHLTVRPVLDLRDEITTDGYRPTTTQTRAVRLRDRHCVFPRCTRPARLTDTDHVDPFDDTGPPGQTTTSNLAPTCRHHHRLKTHAGWRVRALAPGLYLWRDAHRQVFLRCADGATHDLTDLPHHPDANDSAEIPSQPRAA